jgi:hypothetical protein
VQTKIRLEAWAEIDVASRFGLMWMWVSLVMVGKADYRASSQFEDGFLLQLDSGYGFGSKSVSSRRDRGKNRIRISPNQWYDASTQSVKVVERDLEQGLRLRHDDSDRASDPDRSLP